MPRGARLGTLAAVVCLVSGCATHQASGWADRFVAGSGAPIEMELPPAAPETTGAVTTLENLPQRPLAIASDLPTIESEDRDLAAALESLKAAPTIGGLHAVAERYRLLGVLDQAHDKLMEALALDDRDSRTHELLARLWRDWGMSAHGLGEAHRAVYAAPGSASAQNTLGTLLFALGDLEAAQARFETALQLEPGAAFALNNLCYVAFVRGAFEDARSRCGDALQHVPEFRAARNNVAMISAAEGNWTEASRLFGLDLTPGHRQFNLGILRMAGHEYSLAADAFDAASRLAPGLRDAARRAAYARQLAEGLGTDDGSRPRK